MFELSQLQQLIAVAEEGTLSAAAEKLHISQPALSRSMQKLEEHFDAPLFSRTKNRMTLNDTGISPGAGVGNFRMGLSKSTLGIPVIAVGIPLVLTAEAILYSGLLRMNAQELFLKAKRRLGSDFLSMCVTPKDIDAMVKDGASILSYGLNLALFGENYGALEGLMR